jgi:heme-degrading monooxygenase HmoA
VHAAIRRYELGAGSVSDFMATVDAGFADTLSRFPGFLAYHLIDGANDEIISVTLFSSETSAVRSGEAAAEFVEGRLQQFQLSLTSAMSGEVGVSRPRSPAE